MGMPSGTELLLIFGIIVLLFGAKKIPDLAKGLGKGVDDLDAPAPKEVEKAETTASSEASKTTTQA